MIECALVGGDNQESSHHRRSVGALRLPDEDSTIVPVALATTVNDAARNTKLQSSSFQYR
jgi:hypothetical protein